MPNWLKSLRERPEYERRALAGAAMAVLSVFMIVVWGYSMKRVIVQAPSMTLSLADESSAARPAPASADTGEEKSVALEKPIGIASSLLGEILAGVGSVERRVAEGFNGLGVTNNMFSGLGAVMNVFNGLEYLEVSDFTDPLLQIPKEGLHATGKFFERSFAAMRWTNAYVLNGIHSLLP